MLQAAFTPIITNLIEQRTKRLFRTDVKHTIAIASRLEAVGVVDCPYPRLSSQVVRSLMLYEQLRQRLEAEKSDR